MQYNRGEMKREVKAIMRQARPSPLLFTALFLIIVWVGSFVIQQVCSLISGGGMSNFMAQMVQVLMRGGDIDDLLEIMAYDLMGFVTGMVVASFLSGILSYLWSSMMTVGYEGYSLSLQRMENPGVERLFCGFQQFGGVLATRILVAIFTFLWTLLFIVGAIVVMVLFTLVLGESDLLILLLLLVYVAVAVGMVWITLRYGFADYALLDYKLGGLDAIRRSKQMTKGNKGKMFVLNLSFFGWEWLKGVIMGVGVAISVFTLAGQIESIAYALQRDPMNWLSILLSMGAVSLVGIGLGVIGCFVLDLWLTPYRAASMARLYDKIRISGNYGEVAAPAAAAPAAAAVGPNGPVAGPGATVYPPTSTPPAYPTNPSGYGAPPSGYGAPPSGYGAPPSGYGAPPPAYGAGGQAYGVNQTVTPPAAPVTPPAGPAVPPAGQGAYSPPPYSAPTMPLTPSSAAPFSGEAPTIVLAPKEKTPVAPAAPAAPAAPVVHEVPQAPAAPVVHEVPQAPAAPVVHEVPQAPAAPVVHEVPQAPAAPVVHEVPQAPAAPVMPEAPQIPAAPVVPEAPQVPAAPAVPQAPTAPQAPQIPPAAWSSNPNDRT